MAELKNCYYCNSTPEIHSYNDYSYFVICPACGTQTEFILQETEQKAIDLWNNRMTQIEQRNFLKLKLKNFFEHLENVHAKIFYDEKLCVFRCHSQSREINANVINFLRDNPQYARALKFQHDGRTLDADELDNDAMKKISWRYHMAELWDDDITHNEKDKSIRKYWDEVMQWLSRTGEGIATLECAYNYAMNPGQDYPPSFPKSSCII